MEYISSKEIGHADGLSRIIPKNTKPLEETVIASLKEEKELSGLLVTLKDIRKTTKMDVYI